MLIVVYVIVCGRGLLVYEDGLLCVV